MNEHTPDEQTFEVEGTMKGSPSLARLVRATVEEVLRGDPRASADDAVRRTFARLRHAPAATGGDDLAMLDGLVEFACGPAVGGAGPEVVEAATRLILNNVKAAALAVDHPTVRMIADVVLPDGRGDAAVLWSGLRASAPTAALVNGAAIELLDFTETHVPTAVHVGAVIVPAVLAHVEAAGLGMAELVRGVIVGVEVELALAEAVMPTMYVRGFNPTAVCGAIGAAAGCAAASGADRDVTAAAILIAAATAQGLFEGIGSAVWPYEAGSAARAGVMAAALAAAGMDANPKLVDGPKGLVRAMTDEALGDARAAVATLGRRWRALEPSYKRFPTETITQGSLEAVVALAGSLSDEQRERTAILRLRVDPLVADICDERFERFGIPQNATQAQFDLRFVVASAFVRGLPEDARDLFTPERIADPVILGLRERTEVTGDVGVRLEGAWAEAVLLDGTRTSAEVPGWWGSYANPADRPEFERRVHAALPAIPSARRADLIGALAEPGAPDALGRLLAAVADRAS